MFDLAPFFGNRVLKMAKLGSLRRATRPNNNFRSKYRKVYLFASEKIKTRE